DDLADVIAVVRELSLHRLNHGVRLAANRDGAQQIGGLERGERFEETLPAVLPTLRERRAREVGLELELTVAITVGLLAVAREEIGPARAQIAREMGRQHGEAVLVRAERGEVLRVADLRD